MRLLFIFLEFNFACLLPLLAWMLGAFILGWLLNQLFGGNKKIQLLTDENSNLKQNNKKAMVELSNKLDSLDAKHKATLNDHASLQTKYESASTEAGKVSGLVSEIGLLKTKLNEAINKPPVTVEKIVEKPVEDLTKTNALSLEISKLKASLESATNKPPIEKIVEKRVEVPVEKIVEKVVEKPVEDLTKINALSQEITSLKASLNAANNKPPVTVEKIVEKPVEDLTKINALAQEITSLKVSLDAANNKPPVTVEKIVEKHVEDLTKINALAQEITSLKASLDAANNKPPVTVEKIVEKPVEDLTKINALSQEITSLKASLNAANNKPPVTVEKIVEKRVEVPVEKIVEKVVEKPVEDLTKINALSQEITGLKASLATANNKPPVTIEKIVEKKVEVPVEKIVEKKVEDLSRIHTLTEQIDALKIALESERNKPPRIVEKIVEVKAPVVKDYKAYSKLYGKAIKIDDLKLVEGIGPKIEQLFHNAGLKTWASVAASKPERLKEILVAGGERFQMHDPGTWPKQCQMMVDDKWDELKAYQDRLDGGKEPH